MLIKKLVSLGVCGMALLSLSACGNQAKPAKNYTKLGTEMANNKQIPDTRAAIYNNRNDFNNQKFNHAFNRTLIGSEHSLKGNSSDAVASNARYSLKKYLKSAISSPYHTGWIYAHDHKRFCPADQYPASQFHSGMSQSKFSVGEQDGMLFKQSSGNRGRKTHAKIMHELHQSSDTWQKTSDR